MGENKKVKKAKEKSKGLLKEFKAFISRGNVIDLAVGVVIGGAFSAIVTAVVNILLSLCTWSLPGGINGLVTVLPALNSAQAGLDASIGLGQTFSKDALQNLVERYAIVLYPDAGGVFSVQELEVIKTNILSKYTLYGSTYVYNASACINWGAVINALISFIIIAIVLFLVIKVAAYINKLGLEAEAAAKEAYYKKHPEERPVPVEPDKPEPTTNELLTEILTTLKEKK